MLHTYLTDQLGFSYPIIGAPMAGAGGGRLARAISSAGGLGMIGIGSNSSVALVNEESAVARGDDEGRFGLGLMIWAVERRPELLDAAIAVHPFLLSLSFGSPAPYVDRVREAGILIATQVNTLEAAREAERAGVDLIVAQGTEAGGHTGQVGTLPLLQEVLDTVRIPVVAAGGIASPRGLASVLAGGSDGIWAGTVFLACPECGNTEEARSRILAARESETILTSAFDRVQGFAWPPQFPGRALRNRFSDEWHQRIDDIGEEAREQYRRAGEAGDHDIAVIYAGQAVGMVREERPAGEIVRELGEGAETLLRERWHQVLGE